MVKNASPKAGGRWGLTSMLKSSNGLRVDNFFGAQRFFRGHEPKLREACSMDGGRDHGASDPSANAEHRPSLFGQGVVRSIVFFVGKNRALPETGGDARDFVQRDRDVLPRNVPS